MKLLQALDRTLARAETVLLVIFLGTMVLLAFAQVVMRNVFGTGLLWGDTLVRHMVLWAGFIGGALAAFEGRHIGIDALTKFLSPRARTIAGTVTNLFAAITCYYLAQASWTFLLDEKGSGSEFILSLPGWVAMAIIPVGYALIMVHFFVKVFEQGALVLRPQEKRGR